jgi:hypothetical protein
MYSYNTEVKVYLAGFWCTFTQRPITHEQLAMLHLIAYHVYRVHVTVDSNVDAG